MKRTSRIKKQRLASFVLFVSLLSTLLVGTAETALAVSPDHFAWPVGGHTEANNVAWHQTHESGSRAVDIQASIDTEVGAAQSGVVTVAFNGCANIDSQNCGHGFGNHVVVRHDRSGVASPLYTLYGHLNNATFGVGVGSNVVVGQKLGNIALSGRTDGGHTHFAISTCANIWWGSSCTIWNAPDTTRTNVVKGADIPGSYAQLVGGGSSFSDGTFLAATQGGPVYRVAGGAPIALTNWGAVPGCCSNVIFVDQSVINNMRPWPLDGTFIAAVEGGPVYRFAGGAPITLSNWGVIPGCCSNVIIVNQGSISQFDHMRSVPLDGTFIGAVEGGPVYRIAGAAPLALSNWGAVPGCCSNVVIVNWSSITGLSRMAPVPADHTFIAAVEGGPVYKFAGGAPLALSNWGIVPGCCSNVVIVNWSTITSLDHMNALPANGTFIGAVEGGPVYRVAGGAPLRLYNWGAIPGCCNNVVIVNQTTLDTYDHLLATPTNGTVLQGLPSGNYWQINNGHRFPVVSQSGAIAVDDQTITQFPL